jgi:hypothetical protein
MKKTDVKKLIMDQREYYLQFSSYNEYDDYWDDIEFLKDEWDEEWVRENSSGQDQP